MAIQERVQGACCYDYTFELFSSIASQSTCSYQNCLDERAVHYDKKDSFIVAFTLCRFGECKVSKYLIQIGT